MGKYASKTSVSTGKSRQEIESILKKYGADQFVYGWEGNFAFVRFRAHCRCILMRLMMPDVEEFMETPRGRRRSKNAAVKEYEQSQRQRWRAMALVVKAKLEAVNSEIATFEDEFMAYTVLPDGSTVGDFMAPQIEKAYRTGKQPMMLPMPKEKPDE